MFLAILLGLLHCLIAKKLQRKLETFCLLRLGFIFIHIPCSHIWAGSTNCFFGMLDQLQKCLCLVITASKLDSSILTNQFLIPVHSKSFRCGRNRKGAGVLSFIREDVPSKKVPLHNHLDDKEKILVETKPRKTKWLLFVT